MELKRIKYNFSVCKVNVLDSKYLQDEFCFVGKTDEELSLVCVTENAPDEYIEREDGWKAFRIQGVLDFSLIGILSKIADILADHQISIFAVSTYNTDYVLLKEDKYEMALSILEESGYSII